MASIIFFIIPDLHIFCDNYLKRFWLISLVSSDDEGESVLTQLIQLLTLLLPTPSHRELCCNIISNTSNNIISPTVTHPQSKILSQHQTHQLMNICATLFWRQVPLTSNTFDKVKGALKATRFLPLKCMFSRNISLDSLSLSKTYFIFPSISGHCLASEYLMTFSLHKWN